MNTETSNKEYLIKNANIVNEGRIFVSSVLVKDGKIAEIADNISTTDQTIVIDAEGKYLLPGIIDTHVHFRDPGLTAKADFSTESAAAAAGGVTSIIDMPNTKPQTTSKTLLDEKKKIAEEKSLVNYGFMVGATNDNIDEILKIDSAEYAAIKLFLGSSTGNMLVNNDDELEKLFAAANKIIVAHCEDEDTIINNTNHYKEIYGDTPPAKVHYLIRSDEACYKSSEKAINMANKYGTKFHLAHLSTEKELQLLTAGNIENKNITAEVSPNHLWFCSDDYDKLENKIRCNPSIKTSTDREALLQALKNNIIDTVATDHAPHLLEEKERPYFQSVSGMPSIQHSLLTMLEMWKQGKINIETIVNAMCHNPATIFGIKNRGYIRQGYCADLVLIDTDNSTIVCKDNLLYKCKWSPMEGYTFKNKIDKTFINGTLVYSDNTISTDTKGQALIFE
ncbi:MAG: dihydroorotase [Bacteroidales bacterium]|nr:dihydroorotase [Bacteroidales bacterium]